MNSPLFRYLTNQIKTDMTGNFWKFVIRPYGNVKIAYQHWVRPSEFEEYLEDTDARHREELAHVEMSYQDKLDEMEAQLLEAEEAADVAKQTAALAKATP